MPASEVGHCPIVGKDPLPQKRRRPRSRAVVSVFHGRSRRYFGQPHALRRILRARQAGAWPCIRILRSSSHCKVTPPFALLANPHPHHPFPILEPLRNAHFALGLYRFICANGMFVADGSAFERVSIRHAGATPGEVVEANHTAYNGRAIATDFGVGAVYNSKIRENFPAHKHLIFNYVGPASDLLSAPKAAHMYNQWSLNKTESLSLTFDAVRNQRIRCFDWAIAEEYLGDFLNLFRAPGERTGSGAGAGGTTFIYRSHPSKPNDTLMAVNYAFMLTKILRGEPMFADLSLKLQLEQTLHPDWHYADENLPGAFSG